MSERFRNDSPGALTLEQARALEIKRARERRRQAEELAAQGRGEDTEIAHVALGELVIPDALQTPELMSAVRRAAKAQGIPFERLRVGSDVNRINPNTGIAEFGTDTVIYDGRIYPGITATGKAWGSGTQAARFPTTRQGEISGTDYRGGLRAYGEHNGVDLTSKLNDPVFSALDGRVHEIDSNDKSGNFVTVRDAGGNLYGYAHTGSVQGLKVGDPVSAGQQIGSSDGSGKKAPHLHFTYRPGTPENPATRQSPVANPHLIFDNLGGLRRR